jgi:hypothetical protein
MQTTLHCTALLLFSALTFSIEPAVAEQKRDIQGIQLGITLNEAQSKLKCNAYECETPDGHLRFATVGDYKRICLIEFEFKSGLLPPAMIDQVSAQYSVTPDPDIDNARSRSKLYRQRGLREYTAHFRNFVATVGSPVAHWSGPSGLDIRLAVNRPSNGASNYILTLTDKAMIVADRAAQEKAKTDREAEERKMNVNPKF